MEPAGYCGRGNLKLVQDQKQLVNTVSETDWQMRKLFMYRRKNVMEAGRNEDIVEVRVTRDNANEMWLSNRFRIRKVFAPRENPTPAHATKIVFLTLDHVLVAHPFLHPILKEDVPSRVESKFLIAVVLNSGACNS